MKMPVFLCLALVAAAPRVEEVVLKPGDDIAAAIAKVGAGGVVTLAAGKYPSGQIGIGSGSAGLTVRSKPGGRAEIDFAGRGGFYLKADKVTLKDLDILNAQNFAVDVDGSDCTLDGCKILRSGGDVVKLSPGNWQAKKYNRGATIVNCEIGENKGFEGVDCVGQDDVKILKSYFHDIPGWGVYLKGGASRGLIEGNRFVRCGTMPSNPNGAVCLGEHTGPDEVMTNKHGKAWESVDCTVRNNFFMDIDSAAMAAWCAKGARFYNNTAVNVATRDRAAIILLANHNLPCTDTAFVNNIIVGSKEGNRPLLWIYAQGAEAPIVFENNCWFGGNGQFWHQAAGAGPVDFEAWRKAQGADKGSLFADPRLDKEFHLSEGSPCIDKGQVLKGFAEDYDGGRRSGAWDIGADEHGAKASGRAAPPVPSRAQPGLKEARTMQEKVSALQALLVAEETDPVLVAPVARLLVPAPSDVNYVLPVAAADALARCRNDRAAAKALLLALVQYRNVPYVQKRLIAALGRVGHESVMPSLEEFVSGTDADLALHAVSAIGRAAPAAAVEALLRQAERIEADKANSSDARKWVCDRVSPSIVKLLQGISGERYPSSQEFRIWWKRHGTEFRARPEVPGEASVRAGLPPALIVELLFRENTGMSTGNSGASGTASATAVLTGLKPAWCTSAPPNGWPSLDWGTDPAPHAVDLAGIGDHLRRLKSFTLTGWISCRSSAEARGGNRILSWLLPGSDGVELVLRGDGSLQLGVNQPAEASPARSEPGGVPELKETTPAALEGNWRFFAVTYDSTAASGHAKFYLGTRAADARLDAGRDCARGPAGPRTSGALTVGNVLPAQRPAAPDRNFRGIIDEIRVFGSPFDRSGALDLAELIRVQKRVPASPGP